MMNQKKFTQKMKNMKILSTISRKKIKRNKYRRNLILIVSLLKLKAQNKKRYQNIQMNLVTIRVKWLTEFLFEKKDKFFNSKK